MPQAIVDPVQCDPEKCEGGICLAKKTCPVKAIVQMEAHDQAIVDWARCRGCSLCVARCPLRAIELE